MRTDRWIKAIGMFFRLSRSENFSKCSVNIYRLLTAMLFQDVIDLVACFPSQAPLSKHRFPNDFFLLCLDNNGKDLSHAHENHSSIDTQSMSRLSQADSGLTTTTSSWQSVRSRRESPTANYYRHSAASSIDSGRSSTALYDSPKVSSPSASDDVSLRILI